MDVPRHPRIRDRFREHLKDAQAGHIRSRLQHDFTQQSRRRRVWMFLEYMVRVSTSDTLGETNRRRGFIM